MDETRTLPVDILPLLKRIAQQYVLDPHDLHGLSHWGRVLENGLRIAEVEGGDLTVISLFAIFHDACRVNQSVDDGHGKRGALLAGELLKGHPDVSQDQLTKLQKACREHTDGRTDADLTVRICWDSDRLDLARAYITPSQKFLCTPTAKSQTIREWANHRASGNYVPAYVHSVWMPIFRNHQGTYQIQ